MNRLSIQNHLLVCLSEEGSEVTQACCKALRFGLQDGQPKYDNRTNIDLVCDEVNDLIGVLELLQENSVLPKVVLNRVAINAKKAKVRKYMEYAMDRGCINP